MDARWCREAVNYTSNKACTTRVTADSNGSYVCKKQTQKIKQLNKPKHSNDRVYSEKGISPTLNTMQGGNRQPFIRIKEATKKGYAEAKIGDSINLSVPNSKTRRGRVGKKIAQTIDIGMQQYTLTGDMKIRRLTPKGGGNHSDMDLILERKKDKLGRLMPLHRKKRMIRRLTPKECERLQGFPDDWTSMGLKEKFNLKISGDEVKHYIEISDSQRYKVLGNAVTVNVIKAIVNKLI